MREKYFMRLRSEFYCSARNEKGTKAMKQSSGQR